MAVGTVRYPRRLRSALLKLASSAALTAAILGSGCAHTVRLDTTPSGAEVTVNGVHVGRTPVDFRERSGFGKRYEVSIRKQGYKPINDRFRQTEWDLRVVGPALPMIWCPLVWPAAMFSRRARHGYHWRLEAAPGGDVPAPEEYPAPDLPTDYPAPPPEDG